MEIDLKNNLCISILEFKYNFNFSFISLLYDLCISILEFKSGVLTSACISKCHLCISILEKKYRRKGLKNKNLMLLYNKRINKKLKGLTLVFYIS